MGEASTIAELELIANMEIAHASERALQCQPTSHFFEWWLMLFASSYVLHSAAALLTATSLHDVHARKCTTPFARNDLCPATTLQSPVDLVYKRFLTSAVATILHILILTILLQVLRSEFKSRSSHVTEVPVLSASGLSDEAGIKSANVREGELTETGLEEEETPRPSGLFGDHWEEVSPNESDSGYASQDQASESSQHSEEDLQTLITPGGDDPTEESSSMRVFIHESHFGALQDKIKLAVDRDAPDDDTTIFAAFFLYECRPKVVAQLFGYAMFKRKLHSLNSICEQAKDKYVMAHLAARNELKKFIVFAIERRYYDMLTVIYRNFSWLTETTIRWFGQFASINGSRVCLDPVWQYLKENHDPLQKLALKRPSMQNEHPEFLEWVPITPWTAEDAVEEAICHRNTEMVQYWLQKIPSKRLFKSLGLSSILPVAAREGDVEIMRMVLDKEAEMNDGEGIMLGLVEIALVEKHYDIVELLVARGADLHGVSLEAAVRHSGGAELVRSLLGSGRRDFQSTLYGTVLQKASVEGELEIVKLLLDYNHAINPRSLMVRSGNSPLMGAIIGGHVEVVKLLLLKGACPNEAKSAFGNALQTAIFLWGRMDLVEILLDHVRHVDEFITPTIKICTHLFPTPLALAVDREDKELERVLLEKGARRELVEGISWAKSPTDQALLHTPQNCRSSATRVTS